MSFPQATIESFDVAGCMNHCTNSMVYNPQATCGATSVPFVLMAQEPDIAQCIIDLKSAQNLCINTCKKFDIDYTSITNSSYYQAPSCLPTVTGLSTPTVKACDYANPLLNIYY